MNAAVDDERAARPRGISDFVTTMRVAGMNADADDIAGRDVVQIQLGERFVNQMRRAVSIRRGRREHIKPAGRDDGDAKRDVAWVDQMYLACALYTT